MSRRIEQMSGGCLVGLVLLVLLAAAGAEAEEQVLKTGVPEGYMIIEGDIIVPEDFYEEQGKQAWRENYWWPDGIVPYEFDANVLMWQQDSMLAAMGVWESVSSVDFVARTTEPNYVHIQAATVNNSMVGMQGGMQVINIASWNTRLTIAHELMHCLGFWHEQSRPSRDLFVTIVEDSIFDGYGHNFNKHEDAGEWGYYDFASIMHYGECDFSVCQCNANPPSCCCDSTGQGRTIIVKAPYEHFQSILGNRDSVSHLDTLTMMFAYPPEPWWRFCSKDATGMFPDGSFPDPYATFNEAEAGTPPGGVLWIIAPGAYQAVGVHKKPMLLKSGLNAVILGDY